MEEGTDSGVLVDHETDMIIQETVKNEFRESTVITVAHRLKSVVGNDKIVRFPVIFFFHWLLMSRLDGSGCR